MAGPLDSEELSERLILRSEEVEVAPVPDVLEMPSEPALRTLRRPVPGCVSVTIALPTRDIPSEADPFTAERPGPPPPPMCVDSRLSNGRRLSP